MRVLFVNPEKKNCGIHQFGYRVYQALKDHLADFGDYDLSYVEVYENSGPLREAIDSKHPHVIIWSFNPTALPVVVEHNAIIAQQVWPHIKHIGLCHEQEQCMVDAASIHWHWFGAPGFNAWIGHDPTLVIDTQPNIFSAVRPVRRSEWRFGPDTEWVFGNSTFGFHNKGHVRICEAIAGEFEQATIRFNMPPSEYGDPDLKQAHAVEKTCRSILSTYPGIKLEVTHEMHRTEDDLIDFLYGNDVNIFDYDQGHVPNDMRGVASSPDSALSTRRPLIVTNCTMFRHLHPLFGRYPQDGSLRNLINRQVSCNVPNFVYNEWTPARMTSDYVRVINKLCLAKNV